MVAERTISLFSVVLVTLLLICSSANDSTRAGSCTTKIGNTVADTGIQSVDGHKDADEATFVLWSTGRLVHICDGDTTLLWTVGFQAVCRDGSSSA